METVARTVLGAGVRLRVFEHGRGRGPTVVLVHGYPDTSAVWNRVVADLVDDHHVVSYDVRGAGGSEAPPQVARYAMPWLVADLRAVIDAVAPDRRVHVVGHDWGAIEATAAVTEPWAPERIASLTALSAPGLDVAGHRIRAVRTAADLVGGLRQLVHSWYLLAFQVPGLGAAPWRAGLAGPFARRHAALAGPGYPAPSLARDGVRGVTRYRANRPRHPAPRLRVPVRVVTGARDPYVTPWLFDRVAERGDDVTVEVVAGAHWRPRSHPALVADRVRATVAGLGDVAGLSAARRS